MFDLDKNAVTLRIEPQPEALPAGWWLYGGGVYQTEQMSDHLFHNVYGGELPNSTVLIGEQCPILVGHVWFWQGEVKP